MSACNYLAREALLDRTQKVLGYHFFLQSKERTGEANAEHLATLRQLLSEQLHSEEGQYRLGESLVFFEMTPSALQCESLNRFNPAKTVLIFSKSVCIETDLIDAMKQLRSRGFGICLRNVDLSTLDRSYYPLVTHLELQFGAPNFPAQVKVLTSLKQAELQVLACNLLTWQDFDTCAALGLSCFAGKLHLSPRANQAQAGLNTSQTTILQLMEMVRKNTEVAKLEAVLKRDPGLAYKLLLYINSPGFGLRTEVQSLKHAVTVLGFSPLYRWLTLLLATATSNGSSPILLETAITRGRFAELLGQAFMSKTDAENIFVAGMFSLLDRLLGISMSDVLASIQLPEAIVAALLKRSGPFGPYLALAEACELNSSSVASLAEKLQIAPDDVNKAHCAALVWAKSLAVI